MDMSYEQVLIRTRDGECPAYVFTPAEGGRQPAVIFFMDGLGIRPTIFGMGQRLADHDYVVLVPTCSTGLVATSRWTRRQSSRRGTSGVR
jgi:dienelactone hydrolase